MRSNNNVDIMIFVFPEDPLSDISAKLSNYLNRYKFRHTMLLVPIQDMRRFDYAHEFFISRGIASCYQLHILRIGSKSNDTLRSLYTKFKELYKNNTFFFDDDRCLPNTAIFKEGVFIGKRADIVSHLKFLSEAKHLTDMLREDRWYLNNTILSRML